MDAFKLPKSSDEEKAVRSKAIAGATRYAIEVPYKVMKLSLQSMEIIQAMAETGNPNSVSDAGVGALCARTAVLGAGLNVRINAMSYNDKDYVQAILTQVKQMENDAMTAEQKILKTVNDKISGI